MLFIRFLTVVFLSLTDKKGNCARSSGCSVLGYRLFNRQFGGWKYAQEEIHTKEETDVAAWKQIAAPKKEASDGTGGARPCADKTSKKRKLKKLLADDKNWTFIRVIPKTKGDKEILCDSKKYQCKVFFQKAVASWAWESNLNPSYYKNLGFDCQLNERGGWPDEVVPITTDKENKTQVPPLPNTSVVVVLRMEKQHRPLLMEAVAIIKAWFFSPDHAAHLYPTKPEKVRLLQQTGIDKTQLSDWLRNTHKRIWEPPRLIAYAPRSIAAPESIATPGPKRQKRNQVTPADALVQHQKNIQCFENHFGFTFTIPDKAENNTNSKITS